MSASEPDRVVSSQQADAGDANARERDALREQIETPREELGASV
jgi:hypothetical protein